MRNWLRRLLARPSPPPDRYRELIARLPIPTAEQTENFVEYMVGARSWYKHLPRDPPGAPFVVFLDPNAGRAVIHTADGRPEYRDRVDERERFHYTWMPTDEYLAKFGHWHYATEQGTQFVVGLPGIDQAQAHGRCLAQVTTEDGASIDVSPKVLAAGTVHLTAYLHEGFAAYLDDRGARLTDPSGGQSTIGPLGPQTDAVSGLDREMAAEHARQRAKLRLALHRVRSLLAPGA